MKLMVRFRPENPSSRTPAHGTRRVSFRTALLILLILGVVGGCIALANFGKIRVTEVTVSGETLLQGDKIRSEVHDAIGGTFFRVIPRNNYFLISSRRLEMRIRERFPGAASVTVKRAFPRTVEVLVEERELWGLYCQTTPNDATLGSRHCFYVDSNGTAYEELSSVQGSLLPVILGVDPGVLGGAALSPEAIRYFNEANQALFDVDGRLMRYQLATSTSAEMRLELSEGWELRVNSGDAVSLWAPILKQVLEDDIGERRPNLEYIDLRFGNKVFYKFR